MTTLPPTTAAPVPDTDIDAGAIDIELSIYNILSYWPAQPYNSGLDREYWVDSIDISISVEGQLLGASVDDKVIDITISVHGQLAIGRVISAGPVNITISIPTATVDLWRQKCNFVKWSKIGQFDFTIDQSNEAGERPLDWPGCVWHLARLGDKIIAYGEGGVSSLSPVEIAFKLDSVYKVGIHNKGAFAGDEHIHFFIDIYGDLFALTSKLEKLGYSEFLNSDNDWILSYDSEDGLLYICDGSSGYIYNHEVKSFGQGPVNISGIANRFGERLIVSPSSFETPSFEICTDTLDFNTRRPKTITKIELGVNTTEKLYVSLDYRKSYTDDFKQIGWFLVNPHGAAFPRCYGIEFRVRVKSFIYENFKLDYIKLHGFIHGFTWVDFDTGEEKNS